jgi:hypothetical protein
MARHSFSFDLMLVVLPGRVQEMGVPDKAAACSISGDLARAGDLAKATAL